MLFMPSFVDDDGITPQRVAACARTLFSMGFAFIHSLPFDHRFQSTFTAFGRPKNIIRKCWHIQIYVLHVVDNILYIPSEMAIEFLTLAFSIALKEKERERQTLITLHFGQKHTHTPQAERTANVLLLESVLRFYCHIKRRFNRTKRKNNKNMSNKM